MNFVHEQKLIELFRHSQQFYFIITDLNGRFLHVNSLFGKTTEYSEEQLLTISITDVIVKPDIDKCLLTIENCLQQPGDHAMIHSVTLQQNKSLLNICWELALLRNGEEEPEAIQWIGIAEQEKTQESLQQNELFYRSLIADSLDGILLTNDKGIINFASASVTRTIGYEPGELLDKNAFDFLHPDDRNASIEAFFNEVNHRPVSKFINARIKQHSGQWLWCMIRGHNLLANPHIGAMLIYFCDDTLRKNTEAALMESDERFRHLIHHLNLGVILVDEKGAIILCNRTTANMFESTEAELIGFNILESPMDIIHENGDVFHPADFPLAIVLRTKNTVRNVVMGIKRPSTEDRMWLLVSAEPVPDANGNIIHAIYSFTDITERRRLSRQLAQQEIQKQKQLRQATIDGQERERQEIGRELHDNISQYLTTTRLYLDVAKEKAEGEMLVMINQAHKGLLNMINEIRQLSNSLIPPSLSDIGLVESIEDLCGSLINTHAFAIDFQYSRFKETLLPDSMKLTLFRIIQEQINNIIRHAHANAVSIKLETADGVVTLWVTDNGKGFELKSVKKGHGLDNISNRADLFNGKMVIDAAPGKGCTIGVIIPIK